MGMPVRVAVDDGLMLAPSHLPQEVLRGCDHVLPGGRIVTVPVEAHMLDGLLDRTAAGVHPRLPLQGLRIKLGRVHLVHGRGHMVMRAIEGVGPGDTLGRSGLCRNRGRDSQRDL